MLLIVKENGKERREQRTGNIEQGTGTENSSFEFLFVNRFWGVRYNPDWQKRLHVETAVCSGGGAVS